jgi:catechol 2,3-dioxygenase-like lactoylglutathione lyase family enzyme
LNSIEALSAVTLLVADMARSVRFYEALGFDRIYGGENADFTSYRAGGGYLNLGLRADSSGNSVWGRTIFYVGDVDVTYETALAAGMMPEFKPRDAPWGERYFHLRDPDGHELSFARPLETKEDGSPSGESDTEGTAE